MKLAKETWIIAAIALADLVTTIIFIQHHGAEEANPVFSHYWNMGVWPFILAKCICVIAPLFILEWARRRNPRFVSWALRGAIIGYIGLYGVGFMKLNATPARAEVTRSPEQAGLGPSPAFAYFSTPWYILNYRMHMNRWEKRMHLRLKPAMKTHFPTMSSMPPM
ncbi:MAG TPA: DUF5658 family protein [Chthonomonadaceae bacterium]|nr:DUF5658 family protein [Chthonomonadaceae bacterium]